MTIRLITAVVLAVVVGFVMGMLVACRGLGDILRRQARKIIVLDQLFATSERRRMQLEYLLKRPDSSVEELPEIFVPAGGGRNFIPDGNGGWIEVDKTGKDN